MTLFMLTKNMVKNNHLQYLHIRRYMPYFYCKYGYLICFIKIDLKFIKIITSIQ